MIMSRRARLWCALVFGWWTVNAFATASQYYLVRKWTDDPIAFREALLQATVSAYLWIPITLLALWMADRHPLERGGWRRRLPAYLVVAVFFPVVRATTVVLVNQWTRWYEELPAFSTLVATNFANTFFLYWMVVAAAHALHYAHQNRLREQAAGELRAELIQAQLRGLKAQLQPHFLFNTLNTIATVVHEDSRRAEAMITRLSELLRYTLRSDHVHEIELGDELRFVAAYLGIEQSRFEERLRVEWEVDPAASDALVPHLILQPLVENAIKHGLSPRAAPGCVRIGAGLQGGRLHLLVQDDGVGMEGLIPGREEARLAAGEGGVGLSNTRQRLEHLYGRSHRFELRTPDTGGLEVQIEIPYRTASSGTTLLQRAAS